MRVLGLPGKDPETYRWLSEIVDGLEIPCDARIQEYSCWSDHGGAPEFNLADEVATAIDFEPEFVIAKSLGTLVALGTYQHTLPVYGYVLIGMGQALLDESSKETLAALCRSHVPVLFIQQTNDPACSYIDLCASLGEGHNAITVEVSGDDHRYENKEELMNIINDWTTKRVDSS